MAISKLTAFTLGISALVKKIKANKAANAAADAARETLLQSAPQPDDNAAHVDALKAATRAKRRAGAGGAGRPLFTPPAAVTANPSAYAGRPTVLGK